MSYSRYSSGVRGSFDREPLADNFLLSLGSLMSSTDKFWPLDAEDFRFCFWLDMGTCGSIIAFKAVSSALFWMSQETML